MSNPLVVVVDLDGFQHGPDELTPKCLAVACDALQLASQWIFQTGFLASRPREHLSTYYHQSTFVHGLPLTGPGLPQGFFPHVLRNTLDELIIDYYRSSPVAPAPDHFLLFTKGATKVELFEEALSDTPLLLPVECRNLELMHCPTVAQLAPEASGRIVPTQFKATEYAIWLAGQGLS